MRRPGTPANGGVVSPTWIDGHIIVDGVIGEVGPDAAVADAAAAVRMPGAPVVSVHITGDLADDPRAVGLADDIRVLVTAFLAHPRTEPEPRGTPAPDDSVRVALPGLSLDDAAHRVLAGRIRRLVAERTAGRAEP